MFGIPFFFSWEVHFFQLVNFAMLCVLFAVGRIEHRRVMQRLKEGIDQAILGKTYAQVGADVSLRTDNRLATGSALADSATTAGQTVIAKKLDDVMTLLPGRVAEEVRSQAASDSGHALPAVMPATTPASQSTGTAG